MHYYERPVDGKFDNGFVIINEGEMVFTDKMMVHKTFFPVDTYMLSMAKNKRDKVSHEADLVREAF